MNVKHILLDINLSVLPWSELRFQAKDAAHNILIKENFIFTKLKEQHSFPLSCCPISVENWIPKYVTLQS